MNARAAASAARVVLPGISEAQIAESLSAFEGTWRRFEYKGVTQNGARVYDDYAHHPTAVRKTITELRAKAEGKVFVAFHPHLFSRTRDLLNDFATAFAGADRVLIAPIFAAREIDDGSVSSAMLADLIREHGVSAEAMSLEEIEKVLTDEPKENDLIMTMGAGNIYKIADAIVKH
jgi:UDP-N-acetylmuramate--alanine ligase